MLRALWLVPVALQLTSCACTDAGCEDATTVRVRDASGAPISAFEGVVEWADGTSTTFSCDGTVVEVGNDLRCEAGGVVLYRADAPFFLDVTSAEGDLRFQGELDPAYDTYFPNGRTCPPRCLQGTVEVTLA